MHPTPKMSTYLLAICVAEMESMAALTRDGILPGPAQPHQVPRPPLPLPGRNYPSSSQLPFRRLLLGGGVLPRN